MRGLDIPIFCILLLVPRALGERGTDEDVEETVPIVRELRRLAEERGLRLDDARFPQLSPDQLSEEYDFVVVGAGTAGCVLANRLTEQADWTVLVLERGQEGDLLNKIASIWAYNRARHPAYSEQRNNWTCGGLDGEQCHWPTGFGVGGSTESNDLLMTRGHPDDYNDWEEAGNPGWSWEELLPYFLKVENASGVDELADSRWHGADGPVNVDLPTVSPLGQMFIAAGEDMGYRRVDINNPRTPTGFFTSQISMERKRRDSAATAYCWPARHRHNLRILKGAEVTKILVDPEDMQAFGVRYLHRGKEYVVNAKKEVLLSAGALDNPKLLMLSGIGPREELRRHGITPIIELDVGHKLMEHVGTCINFMINTNISAIQRMPNTMPKMLAAAPESFKRWVDGKSGPLSNNGHEAGALLSTGSAGHRPDVELLFYPMQMGGDAGNYSRKLGIPKSTYDKTWGRVNYKPGFMICVTNFHPRSRGRVMLQSSDPTKPPLIEGNLLSDALDVAVTIVGIREAIRLVEGERFREIGAELYREPMCGCAGHKFDSDAYWECVLRKFPVLAHHVSGTCAMGPDPEQGAVVDPELIVHGIVGLRVVDASIMPTLPSAHTMYPTYVIAEKASDMIKNDWLEVEPPGCTGEVPPKQWRSDHGGNTRGRGSRGGGKERDRDDRRDSSEEDRYKAGREARVF